MNRRFSPLHVEPIYPNHPLPARPGEDRPGLSPFGRLAMGGSLGKSSILIYNSEVADVQKARVDMISLEGDDLDAQQLVVTLHPPRVIPLAFAEVSGTLAQQNLTGEQGNGEVAVTAFPGTTSPIQWPPLEAILEFGVGGVATEVTVDYLNGVTLTVPASFVRVRAAVTQSAANGGISGTSAAYYLAAHVGPGFAEAHAQRTIFVGVVDEAADSDVVELPRFAKIATLIGRPPAPSAPLLTVGWIRFWQDPDGTVGVGDVFASGAGAQSQVRIPNAAQYFSVYNQSGQPMKMAVSFGLRL